MFLPFSQADYPCNSNFCLDILWHPCLSPSQDFILSLEFNPDFLPCPIWFYITYSHSCAPCSPLHWFPLFFMEIQLIPASGPFGLLTVLLGLVFPQMRICLLHLSAQVDSPMYPSVPNTQLCFHVFKMKKARQAIWETIYILSFHPPKVFVEVRSLKK